MRKRIIRKVPLDALLDVLMKVYDEGADYVDILGEKSEEGDVITIRVMENYLYTGDMDEEELTDDKLNELI